MHSLSITICRILLFTFCACSWADEPTMRLRLKNSGFALGSVVVAEQPDAIGWQSLGFDRPFLLDPRAVQSISVLSTEQGGVPAVTDGQCFELVEGGMVAGRLKSIDDDWVTIESALLGEVQVARTRVASLVDAGYAGELVYSGPRDNGSWHFAQQPPTEAPQWQFEAGALVANQHGASAVGHVELPSKAQITLTLNWKGAPDFVFSLGTNPNDSPSATAQVTAAARLEVWDKQLALLREVENSADIELLAELSPTNPRLDLTVYLDQEAGTVIVCDGHGRLLDRMTLPPANKSVLTGVQLVNHGSSLTLERFDVRHWDGLTTVGSWGSGVVLNDTNETVDATIFGYDASTEELLLRNSAGEELRRPLAQVRRGDFSAVAAESANAKTSGRLLPPAVVQPRPLGTPALDGSGEPLTNQSSTDQFQLDQLQLEQLQLESPAVVADSPPAATSADQAALEADAIDLFGSPASPGETAVKEPLQPVVLEVVLIDRTRLKGHWLEAQEGRLQFDAVGLARPLLFEPQQIRGVIGSDENYTPDAGGGKHGTIKIGETQLAGHLAEAASADGGTALHWQPLGSLNSSPVSETAEGAIIYRKSLPKLSDVNSSVPAERVIVAPMVQIFLGGRRDANDVPAVVSQANRASANVEREIVFRSGDAIEGSVVGVDESGLRFKSSETQTVSATHEQVQSIRLNRLRRELSEVSPEKLERLMTVPRTMKRDPPTHLFISVLGDFLRGRLVSLDDEKVTAEIRLEIVELPRDQVAQIIWLHDRDWTDDDKIAAQEDEKEAEEAAIDEEPAVDGPFRIHAIKASDRGLTFAPSEMKAGVLIGESDLLGACSVKLDDLNQVLFGRNIGKQIREFRQDPWTLSLAQNPRVFDENDSGAGAQVGNNSPLVGSLAPDFGLKTLTDDTFRLSQSHDRIIVLDFWASWCGPCIQTMPLVEEVVAEIGAEKIHLVAINIQEAPGRVEAAVERLGLAATVLLDRDGEVAAAYSASAIPQTVIIDREGRISHVFVGGGAKFVAGFREALQAAVASP